VSSEIVHVVLFKWKPDAHPDAIEAAIQGLQALREKIDGIVDLTCGNNFSVRAQGYHTALVVRFRDRASLEIYVPHPAHQDVVNNLILPIREDLIVVDYELVNQ
jgi:hypothetical protein